MLREFGTYGLVLYIHSLVRWLVVAAGLYAAARAWRGRLGGHAWLKADAVAGRMFVSALDLQLLIGLLLYFFFSPMVAGSMNRPDIMMGSRGLRFWVFEHPVAGIAAVVLAHIGLMRARKSGPNAQRDASLFFTLALLLVLAAIPWPVFAFGRGLWPIW